MRKVWAVGVLSTRIVWRWLVVGPVAVLMSILSILVGSPGANADPPEDEPPVAWSEGAAMAEAKATRKRVAVESLTTPKQQVVADPSGVFQAEVSAVPERVRKDGKWVPIDTGLTVEPDGDLVPTASPMAVTLSGGGSDPLVVMADGARSLSLTWPTALPAPTVVGESAVYRVAAGIDLIMQTSSNGFSMNLVVHDAAAARNPLLQNIALGWSGTGVSLVKTSVGLEARAADGSVVFAGPRLRMWDSPPGAATGSTEAAVTAATAPQVTKSAEVGLTVTGTQMILSASAGWLTDPARGFPLVVDPTISKYDSSWAMVWNNGLRFWNSGTEHARVGYDGYSDNKISRVYYNFDTANLSGKHIRGAVFSHRQIHSPQFDCGAGSYGPAVEIARTGQATSSTSWSNQPTMLDVLDSAAVAHGHRDYCPGFTTTEWNVIDGVKYNADRRLSVLTLRLRSSDESRREGWRQFDNVEGSAPKLFVTYNTIPDIPTSLQVTRAVPYGGALFVSDATPELSAVVSDFDHRPADGWTDRVSARFFTTVSGSSTYFTSDYVTSGTRAFKEWSTVPNGTYSTYAKAFDGLDWSGSSSSISFTVDTVAPAIPSVTAPTGTVMVGDTVSVTLASSSSDVARYEWGVRTATPTSVATPSTLGGSVTVQVPITQSGPNIVIARAVDRAANVSALKQIEVKAAVAVPTSIYRLDGNGADAVSGSHPLTTPTGTTWTAGKSGGAADQALSVSDSSTVKSLASTSTGSVTTGSFTISAWVYVPTLTTPTTQVTRAAVGLTDGTSTPALIGYRQAANDPNAHWVLILDSASASTNTRFVVTDPGVVRAGGWTHVVGVYNRTANTAQLYVDRQLVQNATTGVPIPYQATRVAIGAAPDGGVAQQHVGAIDNVQLLRGPADSALVSQLYVEPV